MYKTSLAKFVSFAGLLLVSSSDIFAQPAISSVTGPRDATYTVGQFVDLLVTYDQVVKVTGTPQLPLTVGTATVNAEYAAGNGTKDLFFRYQVQASDTDTDGIAVGTSINLNGGTIQSTGGADAGLGFSAPMTTGVKVDGSASASALVIEAGSVSLTGASQVRVPIRVRNFAGIASAQGTFAWDETVLRFASLDGFALPDMSAASFNTSNPGLITMSWFKNDLAGETLADGATIVEFVFDVIGSAGSSTSVRLLNLPTALDFVNSISFLSVPFVTQSGTVTPPAAPTITSVTSPADRTYQAGEFLTFQVNFDQPVTVTGTPEMALTIGNRMASASFEQINGQTNLVFRYQVQPGDSTATGIAVTSPLSLSGGSIKAGSTDATLSFTPPTTSSVNVDGSRMPAAIAEAYIKASNTGAEDRFGNSVAISDDTLVIGSPFEDGDGASQSDNSSADSGAVYVYVRSGGVWTQQAYLKAPTVEPATRFGDAVSISGNTLVATAPLASVSSVGPGAGAAYVFVRNGLIWSHQATLEASNPGQLDSFGQSVSISGDTVVVGAAREDSGFHDAGAAYVFVRNGTSWSQQAFLQASNADMFDNFGESVAISGDTLVVGAYEEDSNGTNESNNDATSSGAAYIFARNGTTWTQQAYLKASNPDSGDEFGKSVSISGDTVVVGAHIEASNGSGESDNSASRAGAAYVFVRSGQNWFQQAYLKASTSNVSDAFGTAVSISGDSLVVGAIGASAAYLFSRTGTIWSQKAVLQSPHSQAASMGNAVAFSGTSVAVGGEFESSGSTGINGDPNNNLGDSSGAAYVFIVPPTPSIVSVTAPPARTYLAGEYLTFNVNFDQPVTVTGSPQLALMIGTRTVFATFEGINGQTNLVFRYQVQPGDTAGGGITLSSPLNLSGGTIVGSTGDAGLSFNPPTTSSVNVDGSQIPAAVAEAYFKASNSDAGDNFGHSVAISGDTMVVGAPREGGNGTDASDNSADFAGAAYVFVRNGSTWTQQAYLKASNAEAFDQFGYSVAISGDTVVVGARQESSNGSSPADNSASSSGAAYVFVRSGSNWTEQAYLKASNPEDDDLFGTRVSISGDSVVVASIFEDGDGSGESNNGASNSGAVYVFVRNGTTWTQQAYLKASNAESDDTFGISVSISGETVVVGANGEDSDGSGTSDNSASSSGAAYVFVRNGTSWSQQAFLKASNAEANDNFGVSISVSGDTLVIGADRESSDGASPTNNNTRDSGAAYVFVRNGATWTQQALLKTTTPTRFNKLGGSLALAGELLVVGASDTSESGEVYVFERNGMTWTQKTVLRADNAGADDLFGFSVAISGMSIVSGAVYEDSSAVGVNGDGQIDAKTDSGSASVFVIPNTQPRIANVIVPNGGIYAIGENLTFNVNFDQPVTVTGVPQLSLTFDSSIVAADFVSGSGTTNLVFSHTVQAGDFDDNGIVVGSLSLNGGTIQASSVDADLTLNSVSNTISVLVDGVAPTLAIGAPSHTTTSTGPVSFTVNYADSNLNIVGLFTNKVILNKTGTADGSVSVSGAGATVTGAMRTVTIENITGSGSLGISIAAGSAVDAVGNTALAAGPSATFIVDGAPRLVRPLPDITVPEDSPALVTNLAGFFTDESPGDLVFDVASVTDTSVVTATITSVTNLTLAIPANINGTAEITIEARDVRGSTVSDSFTLTVTPVNDPPVASSGSFLVNQGDTLTVNAPGVLSGATDVENDPLTAILGGNVQKGTLQLDAAGSFQYTPNAEFFGFDAFTYRANDGMTNSGPAVIVLEVKARPTNAIPTAQTLFVNETVRFSATNLPMANAIGVGDPDSAALTMSLSVTNGTVAVTVTNGLTLANGATSTNLLLSGPVADLNAALESLSYTPRFQYFGDDTLHLLTTDEGGRTNRGNDRVPLLVEVPALGGLPQVSLEGLNNTNTGRLITNAVVMNLDSNLVDSATFDVTNHVVNVIPIAGQDGSTNRSSVTVNVSFSDGTSQLVVVPVIIYQPLLTQVDTNSSSAYSGTFTTPLFNFQTGLFEQKVTVENNTPFDFTALRITATNLPATVILQNATVTNGALPYIDYNLTVPSGGEITLKLDYFSSDMATFTPGLRLELLNEVRTNTIPTNLTMSALSPFAGFSPDGAPNNYVQFPTEQGRIYYLQYQDVMGAAWQTSPVSVTGTGFIMTWLDDGPPNTDTPPGAIRFYRVVTEQ